MKTFVIACGGTGGHLSPGIALAERLTDKGFRCVLVVSKKKIDSRLLEKYPQFEFIRAPGRGLEFSLSGVAKFAASQIHAVFFALAFLAKNRPAAFVSFGGFLTLGMALACKILFIPTILHEANRVPGKAVRWLSRIATRVYLPPGVRIKGVTPLAVRSCGFPVRKEMFPRDRAESRAKIGMPASGKLLVVFGGSQGAKPLNDAITRDAEKLTAAGISVFCVTGPGKNVRTETSAENSATATGAIVRFIPFCDDVSAALSAADLVVSRAGAGSLAEFVACCVPAILVPYPFAADNHQEANAKFFQEKGAGILLPQTEISTLTDTVISVLDDEALLKKFRENIEKMSREFDWSNMLSDLEIYATGKKRLLKTEQA